MGGEVMALPGEPQHRCDEHPRGLQPRPTEPESEKPDRRQPGAPTGEVDHRDQRKPEGEQRGQQHGGYQHEGHAAQATGEGAHGSEHSWLLSRPRSGVRSATNRSCSRVLDKQSHR